MVEFRADRITADAIGPIGQRAFYVQAEGEGQTVSLLVEKQQVQLLATSILEILARAGLETAEGPADEELALHEVEERFRAGRMSIGYEEERDLLLLELEEQVEEDEDGEPVREPDVVRIWATREQMLALARHGTAVAERGRPTCEFCGNPIDPDGHVCPATNGHKKHAG